MFGRRNLYLKFSLLMAVVILVISIGLYAQYVYSRSLAQDGANLTAGHGRIQSVHVMFTRVRRNFNG